MARCTKSRNMLYSSWWKVVHQGFLHKMVEHRWQGWPGLKQCCQTLFGAGRRASETQGFVTKHVPKFEINTLVWQGGGVRTYVIKIYVVHANPRAPHRRPQAPLAGPLPGVRGSVGMDFNTSLKEWGQGCQ